MAKSEALYDNKRSPKREETREAKEGDVRTLHGKGWQKDFESLGKLDLKKKQEKGKMHPDIKEGDMLDRDEDGDIELWRPVKPPPRKPDPDNDEPSV